MRMLPCRSRSSIQPGGSLRGMAEEAIVLISEPSSLPSRHRLRSEDRQRIRPASQWHKAYGRREILGGPIRQLLRSSSNLDGEIPRYIEASTRVSPRLGIGRSMRGVMLSTSCCPGSPPGCFTGIEVACLYGVSGVRPHHYARPVGDAL